MIEHGELTPMSRMSSVLSAEPVTERGFDRPSHD
jgi:hypothetical protein